MGCGCGSVQCGVVCIVKYIVKQRVISKLYPTLGEGDIYIDI